MILYQGLGGPTPSLAIVRTVRSTTHNSVGALDCTRTASARFERVVEHVTLASSARLAATRAPQEETRHPRARIIDGPRAVQMADVVAIDY